MGGSESGFVAMCGSRVLQFCFPYPSYFRTAVVVVQGGWVDRFVGYVFVFFLPLYRPHAGIVLRVIINTSYQKLHFGSGDYQDKLLCTTSKPINLLVLKNIDAYYTHKQGDFTIPCALGVIVLSGGTHQYEGSSDAGMICSNGNNDGEDSLHLLL